MNRKRTIRFREKVMVLVICASMLVTVSMSVVFYRRSAETMKDNYQRIISENLKARASVFDNMMKEAYLCCVNAVTDETLAVRISELQSASGEMEGGAGRAKDYEALFAAFRGYLEEGDSIQSIYCYLPSEEMLLQIGDGGEQVSPVSETAREWMEEIGEESDAQTPFSPVFHRDDTSVIHRHLYTFAKEIYDQKGNVLGKLFVNVDERRVYFSCLQGRTNETETLYILLGDRITSAQAERSLDSLFAAPDHSLIVSRDMSETSYHMVSVADESVITENLRKNRNQSILLAVILNLLLAVPVLLYVRHLMRPLKELEQNMNLVKEGDFSARATIYHADEIGSISEHFNEMISQMEDLIDELVKQKMLKKEAEIEALQYQITPHFMYNTLNSIRYAAVLQNADDIAELLQSFTELLRISASDRGAFITVSQEIRMVRNYMLLQQFRYENSFSAEYEIAPESKDLYVPRLLVQPLVENAILHGMDHGEKNNRIQISVQLHDGMLEIHVTDNGSGMTEEEIEQILSGRYRSKFSGIGIHNIIERLHLYFGSEGSLSYQAQVGEGTAAIIRLPAVDDPEAYTI